MFTLFHAIKVAHYFTYFVLFSEFHIPRVNTNYVITFVRFFGLVSKFLSYDDHFYDLVSVVIWTFKLYRRNVNFKHNVSLNWKLISYVKVRKLKLFKETNIYVERSKMSMSWYTRTLRYHDFMILFDLQ
jgi:hypothetical protein